MAVSQLISASISLLRSKLQYLISRVYSVFVTYLKFSCIIFYFELDFDVCFNRYFYTVSCQELVSLFHTIRNNEIEHGQGHWRHSSARLVWRKIANCLESLLLTLGFHFASVFPSKYMLNIRNENSQSRITYFYHRSLTGLQIRLCSILMC